MPCSTARSSAGINFIDTADVYGQDGLSRARASATGSRRAARATSVVLATKFRFTMGDGPNRTGASRYRIVRAARTAAPAEDRSHRPLPDPHAGHRHARGGDAARARRPRARGQGPLPRLLELRGVSADGQPVAREDGSTSRASSRCRRSTAWSCATSSASTCRCAASTGSASCRGRRSRAASSPASSSAASRRGGHAARPRRSASRASTTSATGRSSTPSARSRPRSDRRRRPVSLAWLLAKPQVTSVIFGARTVEQLDDNLRAADLELSPHRSTPSTKRARSSSAIRTTSCDVYSRLGEF